MTQNELALMFAIFISLEKSDAENLKEIVTDARTYGLTDTQIVDAFINLLNLHLE